jgi:hypothetical protein
VRPSSEVLSMLDIIFLGGGVALLLLMVAYEALCRRL